MDMESFAAENVMRWKWLQYCDGEDSCVHEFRAKNIYQPASDPFGEVAEGRSA